MSSTLANAYVQIIPSADGITGSIKKILDPEAESAGKSSGSKIGSGIVKGLGTMAKVGIAATAVATTAVVGFGKAAIDTGMEFDSSMSQIAATLGMTTDDIKNNVNGAGDTFEALRDKAKQMGSETNFSASEAAEGLNILAMSGYDASESMGMIEDVLHLAAAGSMDMASAASYVSGAMKGFNDETKDSGYYADLMAKGATLANTSVSQLGEAMASGSAGAKAYGQNAESMTVALLRLAEQGEAGAAAGTSLAAVMKNLYTPTDQAAKAMAELGVAAYDESGAARDVNEVINDLNGALSGMSDEQANAYKNTIFGIQGLDAYNKMTVTGIDKQTEWADALAGASEGAGEAAKQYDTMTDNLQGDIDIWNSALDGFKIAISDNLMPSVREFVQFGSDGLSKITAGFENSGLDGAMEAFGEVLADGLNMIITMLPDIVSAGGELLGALVEGIVDNLDSVLEAAQKILEKLLEGIGEKTSTLVEDAVLIVTSLIEFIADNADLLIDAAVEIIMALALGLIDHIPDIVEAGMTLLVSLGEGIVGAIPDIIQKLPELIDSIITSLLESIDLIIDAGIQLFLALIEAIPVIIEALCLALPDIIDAIINGLFSEFDLILDASIKIFMALIDAIPTIITLLLQSLPKIIITINTALVNAVPKIFEKAKELFGKIAEAIPKAVSDLKAKVPQIINAIVTKLKEGLSKVKDVGKNMIEGLWNGINDKVEWLKNKIMGFGKAVTEKIKSIFKVNSPSRVFAEIGGYLSEGLALGILGNEDLVANAMDEIGSKASLDVEMLNSNNLDNFKSQRAYNRSSEGAVISRLYDLCEKYFPEFSQDMVLDSGALVASTAPAMSERLGLISARRARA